MSKKKIKNTRKKDVSGGFSLFNLRGGNLVLFVASVLIISLSYGIYYFFTRHSFFDIKEIIVNTDAGYGSDDIKSSLYKAFIGRNIFKLDLRSVEEMANKKVINVKNILVKKVMPDKIEIIIAGRNPVAHLDSAKNLVIDSEGVILNPGTKHKNLIFIKGISFAFGPPKPGEKIKTLGVRKALLLIEAMEHKNISTKYQVGYIDISESDNIILGINGMAIKMGQDRFTAKIDKLLVMLKDPKINSKEISYIDMRFDNAIISPR